MSKKDLNRGMEIGAKPFEDKFRKMGTTIIDTAKEIEKRTQLMYEKQDAINDNLNNRISGLEKKELFTLNTKHDIKNEDVLYREEQEYLVAYLFTCSNMLENTSDAQKKFVRSVAKYLEVSFDQNYVDLTCVENIERTSGIQSFYQTVMEFLFLGEEDFAFEEMFEEVLSYFGVTPRIKKEIKNQILNIYKAVGAEGIAEKYGYEPVVEAVEKETIIEEEKKVITKCYDGTDISEACADVVNDHKYVELDDYLVYLENDDYFKEDKLIAVNKKSGEQFDLNVELLKHSSVMDTACGFKNCFYYYHRMQNKNVQICRVNVETGEKSIIHIVSKKDVLEYEIGRIYVTEKYMVYSAVVDTNERELILYDFGDKSNEILSLKNEEGSKISFGGFYAAGYYLVDMTLYIYSDKLYAYNIANKEFKCIIDNHQRGYEESEFLKGRRGDRCNQFYKGILYSVPENNYGDLKSFLFIDINNPLSIQNMSLPGYGERRFWFAYGKIFYVTIDSKAEFGYYDFINKETVVLKKNCKMIGHYEEGRLRKKTIYVSPLGNGQIVGKWFYCKKNGLEKILWEK